MSEQRKSFQERAAAVARERPTVEPELNSGGLDRSTLKSAFWPLSYPFTFGIGFVSIPLTWLGLTPLVGDGSKPVMIEGEHMALLQGMESVMVVLAAAGAGAMILSMLLGMRTLPHMILTVAGGMASFKVFMI